MIDTGVKDTSEIIDEIGRILQQVPSMDIEYISIVDADTLQNIDHIRGKVLIAVAVRIGPARLIDNILLDRAR